MQLKRLPQQRDADPGTFLRPRSLLCRFWDICLQTCPIPFPVRSPLRGARQTRLSTSFRHLVHPPSSPSPCSPSTCCFAGPPSGDMSRDPRRTPLPRLLGWTTRAEAEKVTVVDDRVRESGKDAKSASAGGAENADAGSADPGRAINPARPLPKAMPRHVRDRYREPAPTFTASAPTSTTAMDSMHASILPTVML